MGRVPVAVVTSKFEADLIAGLLRGEGIDAVTSADDAGGQEPQWQLQGVRVLVPEADREAATRLLDEQR